MITPDLLKQLINEIRHLGNGNAASNGVGAIEGHAMAILQAAEMIAESNHAIANAIKVLAEKVED